MVEHFNGDPIEQLRSLDAALAAEIERVNRLHEEQHNGTTPEDEPSAVAITQEDIISIITDIIKTLNYGIEPITVNSLDEQREAFNNKNQEKNK